MMALCISQLDTTQTAHWMHASIASTMKAAKYTNVPDSYIFQYIMKHLETNKKPKGIRCYEKNKILWGLLRREDADFFGLDDLVWLLMITFSCIPEANSSEGILHWPGVKKGTVRYVNPYKSGSVSIMGWLSPLWDPQPSG